MYLIVYIKFLPISFINNNNYSGRQIIKIFNLIKLIIT